MQKYVLKESENYQLYFLYRERNQEILIYEFEIASKTNPSEIHQGNLVDLIKIFENSNG